jgi:preprotein translocase subunit Sec63
MTDRVARMYQRIFEVIQEEMQGYVNDQLAGLMKSVGIDLSQLRRMASGQMAVDPYAILGLSKDCSDDELRLRYREIMAKIHPDRAGQEMTCLTSLVNSAYQTICKERGIT